MIRLRNIITVAKSIPMKALAALCTMASFRGPNELPWVPDDADIDGRLVPPSDDDCIESAVRRGKLMAEAIRRAVTR